MQLFLIRYLPMEVHQDSRKAQFRNVVMRFLRAWEAIWLRHRNQLCLEMRPILMIKQCKVSYKRFRVAMCKEVFYKNQNLGSNHRWRKLSKRYLRVALIQVNQNPKKMISKSLQFNRQNQLNRELKACTKRFKTRLIEMRKIWRSQLALKMNIFTFSAKLKKKKSSIKYS